MATVNMITISEQHPNSNWHHSQKKAKSSALPNSIENDQSD
jgi:hypothetical protein